MVRIKQRRPHGSSNAAEGETVVSEIENFFERLTARGYEPLFRHTSGTIECRIEGLGSWFIIINDGEVTVSRNQSHADCIIETSAETFMRIVKGEQHPVTAALQGKIKITGNTSIAQVFQRSLPDPYYKK
jgi:hypothetical protein